uniref:Uncharacterized protein n=1 Tax=Xiphophorus maculatus TaxID=8083 RepID=A0A3B5QMV8_XIPMA
MNAPDNRLQKQLNPPPPKKNTINHTQILHRNASYELLEKNINRFLFCSHNVSTNFSLGATTKTLGGQ